MLCISFEQTTEINDICVTVTSMPPLICMYVHSEPKNTERPVISIKGNTLNTHMPSFTLPLAIAHPPLALKLIL